MLDIATCANQDPLQATTGMIPLLGVVCIILSYGILT
jgi:hypothetical protein